MSLISTGIAAKKLGIHPNTLRRNYKEYGLTRTIIGKVSRWNEEEIKRYLDSHGVSNEQTL